MSRLKLIEASDSIANPMKPMYESVIGALNPTKRLKLHGTAIVCDEPGINGRTYPTRLMTRESKKYYDNYIRYANSMGELNHPAVDEEGNSRNLPVTEINLSKVSHLIEELFMNNNLMKIKFRIIEKHPCGAMLKAIIDDGIPVGVSLRGLGSVYRDGSKNIVADDYDLITIDVVGRPSYGKAAMMQSVMESINDNKIPLLTEAVEYAVNEFKEEIDYATKHNIIEATQYYSLNKLLNNISK